MAASSMTRPAPCVLKPAKSRGTSTAAVTSGRAIRNQPILRCGPRSASRTTALAEELTQLAQTHRARHQAAVTVNVDGDARTLPPDAALALLGTAQESLVNAAKHAGGARQAYASGSAPTRRP